MIVLVQYDKFGYYLCVLQKRLNIIFISVPKILLFMFKFYMSVHIIFLSEIIEKKKIVILY